MDVWPGVFLGAFVANITTHEPLLVASCIATGNTLQAVTAAWVLRQVVGTGNATSWLQYAIGLVVFGAVASRNKRRIAMRSPFARRTMA